MFIKSLIRMIVICLIVYLVVRLRGWVGRFYVMLIGLFGFLELKWFIEGKSNLRFLGMWLYKGLWL